MSEETIPQYLARVFMRDIENGQASISGLRDTREVADYFGININTARRRLNKLYEDGLVVGYAGCPCLWSATGRALQGALIELRGS